MGVSIVEKPRETGAVMRTLKNGLPDVMRRMSVVMSNEIIGAINKGFPPPNAPLTAAVKGGTKTLRDNGELMASIAAHSGTDWASAGTNKKQASALQHGKTITAKGKGLWLPANANTRRLYRKYNAQSPGALIAAMKGDGYSFFKMGKVFCARKKGAAPFAVFIIKKQVTIPARPFIAITAGARKAIKKIWGDAVKTVLSKK